MKYTQPPKFYRRVFPTDEKKKAPSIRTGAEIYEVGYNQDGSVQSRVFVGYVGDTCDALRTTPTREKGDIQSCYVLQYKPIPPFPECKGLLTSNIAIGWDGTVWRWAYKKAAEYEIED